MPQKTSRVIWLFQSRSSVNIWKLVYKYWIDKIRGRIRKTFRWSKKERECHSSRKWNLTINIIINLKKRWINEKIGRRMLAKNKSKIRRLKNKDKQYQWIFDLGITRINKK